MLHRKLLVAVLALAACGASLGLAPGVLAQGDDHDHGAEEFIVLDQFDTASRQRAREIFAKIVCACPSENWSKTLLNCPNGCSNTQKQEILHQIEEGWDDARIVEYQVTKYGGQALGKPDDLLTYLLPVLVLVVAAGVAGMVLMRWRASSAQARVDRSSSSPAADDELAAVERELKELR